MFGIRMSDWTYRELEADMMIEVNDELIFCMMDVGIVARFPKSDVRIVTQQKVVYPDD